MRVYLKLSFLISGLIFMHFSMLAQSNIGAPTDEESAVSISKHQEKWSTKTTETICSNPIAVLSSKSNTLKTTSKEVSFGDEKVTKEKKRTLSQKTQGNLKATPLTAQDIEARKPLRLKKPN